ncbi:hypothetical protein [Acaryochloris sp. CCMEE 5410]|uniref:hypothetical protein n=1 Tax=Acaryochloris sp. CCMEE 5410 TaxID=310037 RepID=UPI0002483E32|nr:hypothetical protein [Acaryochloris sp. CCMEE 5410]KAI9134350.1 hypothetical protein ON05_014385 [Acaryochloris sp. CCMEE 5410]
MKQEIGAIEIFAWGFFGGAASYLLGFIKLDSQTSSGISEWMFDAQRRISVIVVTILIGVIGGFLDFAYMRAGQELSPPLAIYFGFSAPAIIGSMFDKLLLHHSDYDRVVWG